MYNKKKCPTTHVISGILNVIDVRHFSVMESLKEFPTPHVQVKFISDASMDTVLSRIAVRVCSPSNA